jgi:enterochelin esterase-like enzyme
MLPPNSDVSKLMPPPPADTAAAVLLLLLLLLWLLPVTRQRTCTASRLPVGRSSCVTSQSLGSLLSLQAPTNAPFSHTKAALSAPPMLRKNLQQQWQQQEQQQKKQQLRRLTQCSTYVTWAVAVWQQYDSLL